MTISTFTIAPSSIVSGATATATVTLSGPAPFGGATVAIEPQRRNVVIVPASVAVPEGAVAGSFAVTGDTVHGKKERVVDIAVTYNGITLTTPVSVRPPVSAMQDTPATIQCASAALVPCLTAAATAPITTFAAGNFARSYSFYTPELNLMAETEETTLPAPRIAYEYIWFAGQPLAQVNRTAGELAYYFNDHLGTPLLQTNASATVVWRAEHEPYGTVHSFRVGTGNYQPVRFPWQEAGDSELAYNIFRWYRAGGGRYTQADPLGLDGGVNLFSYVDNNPINDFDLLGLLAEKFQICCKPISGTGGGRRKKASDLRPGLHCYARMFRGDGSSSARSWGLLNIDGQAVPGINQLRDLQWQEPKWCGPVISCDSDIFDCLENVTRSYPTRPYPTMGLEGPNSNTFARKLSEECGIPPPPEANSVNAPGWNWARARQER